MKTLTLLLSGCLCAAAFSVSGTEMTPVGTRDDAAALVQQADARLQTPNATKSDYQAAADLLVKATKLDPANMDICLKLGWVYQDRLHDPQSAYPYLKMVVKRRPQDADGRKLLGLASSQTCRLREADTQFEQAASLQPNDLWIRANLARSLARLGEYKKAADLYADILSKDPNNADARLGQSELSAWSGNSGRALKTLDQLVQENPTNVDALILRGDVNRWDWDMTQARADYQQALSVAPDDHEATAGLTATDEAGLSSGTAKAYQFIDNQHFFREFGELDSRIHLNDRAYLIARADTWNFTQPGFNSIYRTDGAVGTEYHFSRYLEASLEGDIFDYQHREAFFGGQLSTKLSPITGCDIYTILSYNQPFISSMPTVANALKQSSIGNGVDINLGAGFSVQNGLSVARITDRNTYWEEKPQISYRLFGLPLTFIRVEYDYLHYSSAKTNYFTPSHWQLLSPVLDTSIPLGKIGHFSVDARAPYVFDSHKFGYELEGGPVFDLTSRLQLGGSYTYASVPGDPRTSVNRPPWSGHGWQAFVTFRF